MKTIIKYVKPYKWVVALAILLKFVGTIADLMVPYILEHIIDNVVPMKSPKEIIHWGIIMALTVAVTAVLNITANRTGIRVSRYSTYDLRRDVFAKTLNLSGKAFDELSLPSLISRMTSDSYNVQDFIRMFQTMGIRAPFMLVGGIIVTLSMDAGLAMILCITAPVLLAIIIFISAKGVPLFLKIQSGVDEVVRIMRENITGIRVVKALSKEPDEKNRFGKGNDDLTKREIRANAIMSLPGPIVTLVLNIGLVAVIYAGSIRVNAGVTKPGVILAFLTYFNMILMGVMVLNRFFMQLSKANASANRLAEVLEMEEDLVQMTGLSEYEGKANDYIVFDNVSFSYPTDDSLLTVDNHKRQNSLNNITFTIKKGESLGIIGATGSGKTTILNLLMRFYDATEGRIFIDGKDVRSYEKDELHSLFGSVFQNDVIFADTLRENICFGKALNEDMLRMITEDAGAFEFISKYEEGYDYKAAIHGANLSGGQKQRILISRALAGTPDILVLDDSSSALDYKTDANVRRAIREHHGGTTSIVIAQRVSSIIHSDNILVLEEGDAIGYGSHEHLMETCPVYRDIVKVQMGEAV